MLANVTDTLRIVRLLVIFSFDINVDCDETRRMFLKYLIEIRNIIVLVKSHLYTSKVNGY